METLINTPSKRELLSSAARSYVEKTHLAKQAGDAWHKVIEGLNIQRASVPGLIEAAKEPFPIPVDAGWVIRKIVNWRTYKLVWQLMRTEGFDGIKKRVVRR
jgi:hypothetical protein